MLQLISTLKRNHRFESAIILTVSMSFSVILLAFRIHHSSYLTYVFLSWNLFLACIPFVISTYVALNFERINRLMLFGLLVTWLLFFPNAPYIMTDLFHLRPKQGVPLWYDLVLILSFGWNGLMLSFISLADIHQVMNKLFNKLIGWAFIFSSIFLASFGIYIGRYLRWNSWDVLTNPMRLTFDLIPRFTDPRVHWHTWGVTILFSAFLLISYLTIRQLMRRGMISESE